MLMCIQLPFAKITFKYFPSTDGVGLQSPSYIDIPWLVDKFMFFTLNSRESLNCKIGKWLQSG